MDSDFAALKDKGEAFYATVGSVFCPYFREDILFTQSGLDHLNFKRGNKQRVFGDRTIRFKLLPLVPIILAKSHTLQGIFETKSFESVRVHNRVDSILKQVTYYEFIAVISNYRIKVIVKQVEGRAKIFWSVIPFWKKSKDSTRQLSVTSAIED